MSKVLGRVENSILNDLFGKQLSGTYLLSLELNSYCTELELSRILQKVNTIADDVVPRRIGSCSYRFEKGAETNDTCDLHLVSFMVNDDTQLNIGTVELMFSYDSVEERFMIRLKQPRWRDIAKRRWHGLKLATAKSKIDAVKDLFDRSRSNMMLVQFSMLEKVLHDNPGLVSMDLEFTAEGIGFTAYLQNNVFCNCFVAIQQ